MGPSSTGGSRTHTPQGLSLSALPVGAPCRVTPAPLAGFEPAASTLTKWRALLAAPQGRVFHLQQVRAPGGSRTRSSAMARRQASRYITGASFRSLRPSPRQESNLCGRATNTAGCRYITGAVGGVRPPVSSPGIEPGLQPSEGRVRVRHTPRTVPRAPGGGRTRDSGVGSRRVAITPRVHTPAVRSEGVEPSTSGLRDRHATCCVRTSMQSPVGESNPYPRIERPVSWPLDERVMSPPENETGRGVTPGRRASPVPGRGGYVTPLRSPATA